MAKKKTKPRLSDVARAAGVSLATVSRVATGTTFVAPAIQERVRGAAARLDVDLSRKRSRVIALLLSNRQILHPYHSQILTGAEAYCAANDYSVLFLSFRYEAETPWREVQLPKPLQRHDLVSGFIVAGTNSPTCSHCSNIAGFPLPCSETTSWAIGNLMHAMSFGRTTSRVHMK